MSQKTVSFQCYSCEKISVSCNSCEGKTKSEIFCGIIFKDGSKSTKLYTPIYLSYDKLIYLEDLRGNKFTVDFNKTTYPNFHSLLNSLTNCVCKGCCTGTAEGSIDLTLNKSVNKTTHSLGDTVEWKITVSNFGSIAATGVTVIDSFPSNMTFISASMPYNSSTGTWNVGNLGIMQTAMLTIKARSNSIGTYVNGARVFGTETETNLLNNKDTAKTNSIQPCLAITFGLTATMATCNGNSVNNDARLTVLSYGTADRFGYSVGCSYMGVNYFSASPIPVGGVVANMLSNPVSNSGQDYSVRLFFGSDNCYRDVCVNLPKRTNCCVQENAGMDGTVSECSNSGNTINLYSVISGEDSGGTWTRISGTGGVFSGNSFTINGTATTSSFRYVVYSQSPCVNDTSIATINVTAGQTAGTDGSITECDNSTSEIDLYSIISGESLGGTWTRLSGTGGTFNPIGTFIPNMATTSTFRYFISGSGSCPSDESIATVETVQCVVKKAELRIEKEAARATNCDILINNIFSNEEFCYRITICNLYDTTAQNVVMKDTLPTMTYVSHNIIGTPSGTLTATPFGQSTIITYTLPNLVNRFTDITESVEVNPPLASCRTLEIKAIQSTIAKPQYYLNKANVTTTTPEYNTYPNTDPDTLFNCVKLDKQNQNLSSGKIGDTVTYIICIHNYNQTLSGNLVTDLLPSGLTYLSHQITNADGSIATSTYNPVTGIWNFPSIGTSLPTALQYLSIKAIINTNCTTIINNITTTISPFNLCVERKLSDTINVSCANLPVAKVTILDTSIAGNTDFKKVCFRGYKDSLGFDIKLRSTDSFMIRIPELGINTRMKIPFCTTNPSDFTDLGTRTLLSLFAQSVIIKNSAGSCVTAQDLFDGFCIRYDRFKVSEFYGTWGDGCNGNPTGTNHTYTVQSYCATNTVYSVLDTKIDPKCFGYLHPNFKTSYNPTTCGSNDYRADFVVESQHIPQTIATYLDFVNTDSATSCTPNYTDVSPTINATYCVDACSDCVLRHKVKVEVDNTVNISAYFPNNPNICLSNYNMYTENTGMRIGGHIIYNWVEIEKVGCNQFRFNKMFGNDLGVYYDGFPSYSCYGTGTSSTAYPFCTSMLLKTTDYGAAFKIYNSANALYYACPSCAGQCDNIHWNNTPPLQSDIVTFAEGLYWLRNKFRTLDCTQEIMENTSPLIIYSY